MLFSTLRGYGKDQFIKDAVAGIIVAIIALPLSIALALASGVGPEEGLYTAIIAGFLISFFGGSKVQIAGPTAAFATIVAGIVARNGLDGLAMATVIAGVLLILMGVLRLGTLIKFIPFTITTGFTAGIAVTILIGQLKDFFGITIPAGTVTIETMEKAEAFVHNFNTFNYQAVIVGVVCLLVLVLWEKVPKIGKLIPASLISVLVGIAMVGILKMKVNTIGDLYTISNRLPSLHIPKFSWEKMIGVAPDGFTIAILAAIESLLSCVVADGMIGDKHRPNQELVAQGIGNIGSALFGGIPATGAIARTAANIKNGGRTPIAGIVHSLTLVLVLVVLMPYAALIPMPTIAAILFVVAYNMCGWRTFVKLCKTAPLSDIAVLVVTFILTVVFDLVVAIGVGMVMACVLLMKRMADDAHVSRNNSDSENTEANLADANVSVFELNGPMFFGATDCLSEVKPKATDKAVIVSMLGVFSMDATAMNAFEKLFEELKNKGVRLILCHVNEQPLKVMERAGYVERIGINNIFPNTSEAMNNIK